MQPPPALLCYGLGVCVPPRLICWNPSEWCWEVGPLGDDYSMKVGSPLWDWCLYKKRKRASRLCSLPHEGTRRRRATPNEKRALPRHHFCRRPECTPPSLQSHETNACSSHCLVSDALFQLSTLSSPSRMHDEHITESQNYREPWKCSSHPLCPQAHSLPFGQFFSSISVQDHTGSSLLLNAAGC